MGRSHQCLIAAVTPKQQIGAAVLVALKVQRSWWSFDVIYHQKYEPHNSLKCLNWSRSPYAPVPWTNCPLLLYKASVYPRLFWLEGKKTLKKDLGYRILKYSTENSTNGLLLPWMTQLGSYLEIEMIYDLEFLLLQISVSASSTFTAILGHGNWIFF